ncbi:hypothetical protein Bca4012_074314 [Brassica carinata]|uniref:Uncharacterized protein n=1 Tax=Brassica carinata TaxID=52824 RepID=A0A8X7QL14_BRACI|nr:hypothetical protein Bca52824_066602 [Brassica carinata]
MVTLDEQTRSGESQLRNGGCGGGGGNKKTDSSLSTVVPLEHLRQLRRSNGCSRVTGRRQADPRDDVVSVIKVVGAWWRSGAIVIKSPERGAGHCSSTVQLFRFWVMERDERLPALITFHVLLCALLGRPRRNLNRARAPLLEIVTEPHMGSGVEAGEYASEMQ